jgi:hypothetical protein
MSGSFHFLFFVFGQSDQKRKNQLFVYFLYKKSAFCLKITAIFFLYFGHFDQKTKNEMNPTIITLFHKNECLNDQLYFSTANICQLQICKNQTWRLCFWQDSSEANVACHILSGKLDFFYSPSHLLLHFKGTEIFFNPTKRVSKLEVQAFLDLRCWYGDPKEKLQKQKLHKSRLLSSNKGEENRIEL